MANRKLEILVNSDGTYSLIEDGKKVGTFSSLLEAYVVKEERLSADG